MSFFDAAAHRLRSLLRSGPADHERDEEFEYHQSLAMRDAGGNADARYAARREFGNPTYIKEEVRWMGALRWIDQLTQDLRFAMRTFARTPVFTIVVVLSLGLGIGANTAVFGVIHSLLLERLPIPRPRELVQVWRTDSIGAREPMFSAAEFDAMRAAGARVSAVSQAGVGNAEIAGVKEDRLALDVVDGGFLSMLGVRAESGRLIAPADERNVALVAVLTFDAAVRYFGSAEAALNQRITLDRQVVTIVGVTQRGFSGIMIGSRMGVMVPRTALALIHAGGPYGQSPLMLVTRDRAGEQRRIGIERAFADCCADGQLTGREVRRLRHQKLDMVDISRGISAGKGDMRALYSRVLYTMMVGVAIILLIACTNVGNLLLARATTRSREFAVRLSMGASRVRIVRQLLAESAVLGALGAGLGIALAVWGTAALSKRLPGNLRMLEPFAAISPNGVVLLFTVGIAVACALVFGVLPAFRATRIDPIDGLRSGSPTSTRSGRLDRGIIALQMGLALVLVTSAGLLGATLNNLKSGMGDLDPGRLLVAEVEIRGTSIAPAAAQGVYQDIGDRLSSVPGITAISETDVVPLIYMGFSSYHFDAPGTEDRPESEVETGVIHATPGFLKTMRVALRSGREFEAGDVRGAPQVAVISERVAREFFGDRDPIGQMFGFRGSGRDIRIVGVARDVKQTDLRAAVPRIVYLAMAQHDRWGDRNLWAMRTEGPAAALSPVVKAAIQQAAPAIRVRHVVPLTWFIEFQSGREQALATVAVVFSVLALGLAVIGLYGVMMFQVSARSREIGVRMALGADRRRVVRMVLGQSLGVIATGVGVGLPLALVGARSLRALLYGVSPFDPVPLASAVLVLLFAGLVAALLPSRRAAGVDPLVAMRAE